MLRALTASASASPADMPEPARPARFASAAWPQAVSNHSPPERDGSPSQISSRATGVGRSAGELAQAEARQAAAPQTFGQARAVHRGIVLHQPFADGDRTLRALAGLGIAAEAAEHMGRAVMGA